MVSITDDKIAASVPEGRNLARNPDQGTAAASDWTYHFFQLGKTLFAILIGELYSSFTKNIVCSTHLRVKIFSQSFLLSSLIMYIINPSTLSLPCSLVGTNFLTT